MSILGYEGLYSITKDGKVIRDSTGALKSIGLDKYGYQIVSLYKNGVLKICKIHRLVAKAYIPNPENKPQVNHVDGNKQNNHVSNLEWCTPKENIRHAFNFGLMKMTEQLKINISNGLKGRKFTEEHKRKIGEKSRGRKLSIESKQKISKSKIGKKSSLESIAKISGKNNKRAKAVICINTSQKFDTVKDAATWSNQASTSISAQIRGRYKSSGKHPITGEKLFWQYA